MPGSRLSLAAADHALSRARERYGLDLDVSDLRRIVGSIHHGGGIFLVMQSATRYLYQIHEQGQWCVVVYDPTGHRIRTFLPPMGDYSVPEYLDMIRQHFEWEN